MTVDDQPSTCLTSIEQFQSETQKLVEEIAEDYSGSLEQFLRALMAILCARRFSTPSYSLFLEMISTALRTVPPDLNEVSDEGIPKVIGKITDRKFLLIGYDNIESESTPKELFSSEIGKPPPLPSFLALLKTLRQQIFDLHTFRVNNIEPDPYFGDIHLAGWHNLHVIDYLNAGLAGNHDHRDHLSGWEFFKRFLCLGQMYE